MEIDDNRAFERGKSHGKNYSTLKQNVIISNEDQEKRMTDSGWTAGVMKSRRLNCWARRAEDTDGRANQIEQQDRENGRRQRWSGRDRVEILETADGESSSSDREAKWKRR